MGKVEMEPNEAKHRPNRFFNMNRGKAYAHKCFFMSLRSVP